MRTTRRLPARAAVLLAAVAAAPVPLLCADAPDRGSIVVTLGDGTTVPLRNWSLSYEYAVFRQGTSPLAAPPARKESGDLLVGKRSLPISNQTLTFTYDEVPRALVASGVPATDRFKRPREIVLTGAEGKKTTYKVEPPARDLLVASPEKGTSLLARSLDLRGETVTGTKKDFCLLSYTAAVECGGSPADAVVKVEFHP